MNSCLSDKIMRRQNDGCIIKELNQLKVMFLMYTSFVWSHKYEYVLVIPDIYLTRFFTVCFLFRILFLSLQESDVCSRALSPKTESPRSKLTFLFFVPAFFKKQLFFWFFFPNTLFCVSYWDKFISLHIIAFLWVGVFAAVFARIF